MSKNNTSKKIGLGVGLLAIILLGAACSKSQNQKNSNDLLGLVTIPAPGDKGQFMGNLDTLAFTEADLPVKYGPYEKNRFSQPLFDKVQQTQYIYQDNLIDASVTQYYYPQTIDSATSGFLIGTIFQTFSDTGAAVDHYNNAKLTTGENASSFSGVGDANFYVVHPGNPATTKSWQIFVLKSNLFAEFNLIIDVAATPDDVKAILDIWQQKVAAYQPGTAAEVAAENATAGNLNINIGQ